MHKKIAVIGLGSAGIQQLCNLLAFLDKTWTVYSIHSPKIDIVGIGESTNPVFMDALYSGIDFNVLEDLDEIDGTFKLSTKYIKWRKKDFHNPLISGSFAIHFNTHKLKDFAIPRLKNKWKDKFKIIEGVVDHMNNLDDCVELSIDGDIFEFDYVIDCRGFPKDYSEYNVYETQTVNHCFVHNKMELIDDKFTSHVATKDGWMFIIPLQSRTSYGYLFNDKITPIEEAKKNFSETIGVAVEELDTIEYSFKAYSAKQIKNGRIFKNGNSALFFEPLYANSLYCYNHISSLILNDIKYGNVDVNCDFDKFVIKLRSNFAYHYHGGSTFDSDFWRITSKHQSKLLKETVDISYYRNLFSSVIHNNNYDYDPQKVRWIYDFRAMLKIDRNMEYYYLSNEGDI